MDFLQSLKKINLETRYEKKVIFKSLFNPMILCVLSIFSLSIDSILTLKTTHPHTHTHTHIYIYIYIYMKVNMDKIWQCDLYIWKHTCCVFLNKREFLSRFFGKSNFIKYFPNDFSYMNAMCTFIYLFVVYFSFATVISPSIHRYLNYFDI